MFCHSKKSGRNEALGVIRGMAVYLTVREVAVLARCEHKSVRRAIVAGRLRAFQPTNKLLIREDDAYAWIEGRPVSLRVLRSSWPARRESAAPPAAVQRPR